MIGAMLMLVKDSADFMDDITRTEVADFFVFYHC